MKPKIKSKTINAAAAVAALGIAETNWHLLQNLMGDWYGASYILIGMVFAYLRTVTTEPLK